MSDAQTNKPETAEASAPKPKPKYACFNQRSFDPKPVIGWYDTAVRYPSMPHPDSLIEVSDDVWQLHLMQPIGWHVMDGKLVRITPE